MKLKITFILALFFIGFTNAQTKVGTVDSELIISKMPQMKGVLQRVENYGKQLDSSFQIKATEYKSKIDSFKAEEKIMTDDDKKTRVQEIQVLEQEMAKFRQNGTAMMQIQREQSLRPLYKKVSEVIAEVAKENGYTQILTTTGNEFGYLDERFDITKLVLDKLGIKE
ncbi:periplasmic chaperone for outer membrane proteins Skp [Tenacibaculum lutimaris]|uniref:Periplasmic chaperone for outer membrane proteins Skp n=1 Tax=Tenacibaculum lutimaris TaxID=285258 RepID=A0A420E1S8_9FLAO|nr:MULTISPECIES: OmpH family outer membrane protein [Tenacibaculum]RKF03827.1 periplasmic chaperone for outer membrane proteins Skp [Tenacibaculum lutimaris]